MSKLVVRTDGILAIDPSDVAILTDRGLRFREATCKTEDDVIREAQGASGLLVLAEPITARVLDALPELEVVARFGVGLDTIDIPAATERGVRVVNVPDANSPEVAAHAIAFIMSLVRRLPQHDQVVQSGRWGFALGGAGTRRLTATTVGIVGFGRIGQRVAEGCRHLGFQVVVHDPFVSAERIEEAGFEASTFDGLIARSDVLSLHVPLTEENRHLVDAAVLAAMPRGSIVVNVSRGGLIDELALAEAVESGHVTGAGLDTFANEPLALDSPLRGRAGVLLSPHAAHYSEEALRETIERAFLDVARVLLGEPPRDPVN